MQGIDTNAGKIGDVIIDVDGKPVRKLSDLTDALQDIKLPGKVELTVQRNGAERKVPVNVVSIS